jgi:hypothetical protein
MKTFLYAAVFAAVCLYAMHAKAQQQTVAQPVNDPPQMRNVEKYYVVFLAHQSSENKIAMSHTFALFLRTQGDQANRNIIETATINWLPASGQISVVRPAEPGVNKELAETLAWARGQELEISVIGPFEIDADFYRRAAAQMARLERGELQYRCYNANSRVTAKNCIYAVADIFEDQPQLDTGGSRGLEATQKVVEYFRPRFKSPELMGTEWLPLLAEFKLAEYRRPTSEMTAAAE